MVNRFRLNSTVYERETEKEKELPAKIFFLSVEGNVTEKEYFQQISNFKEQIGITGRVDVKVLERAKKDTNSAPKHVIELLEEYIRVRGCLASDFEKELIEEFKDKYSEEMITSYINEEESFDYEKNSDFTNDLKLIGYDLEYRKYLAKYDNELDEFVIIIDRDQDTHSEKNMKDCIAHCQQKGYLCFISNPCFEFWLLMHLTNINEEYKDMMETIKANKKISRTHTYVSKEVSNKAGHAKARIGFEKNYLPKIEFAIKQAENFALSNQELITQIGSNIGKLIAKMKEDCRGKDTGK